MFRPHHLPPKSAAETRRHQREVQRMNRLYKGKLEREAKAKTARRQKAALSRERAQRASVLKTAATNEREKRLTSAMQQWTQWAERWDVENPRTSKSMHKKVVDMLWRTGVPPQYRKTMWPLLVDNRLMISAELYQIFLTHARNARSAHLQMKMRRGERESVHDHHSNAYVDYRNASGGGGGGGGAADNAVAGDEHAAAESHDDDEKQKEAESIAQRQQRKQQEEQDAGDHGRMLAGNEATYTNIEVDLQRTFPQLAFFQSGDMNGALRDVLETYVFYRPDVGYVQGMSYVAGNLLLYMQAIPSFICLANILNSPFFHVFLKLEPSRMQSRYNLFTQILISTCPALAAHMAAEDVAPELYFLEWCITLFCKRLALDVVGRVWELLFVIGEQVIYRAAVAILKILEKTLLTLSFGDILKHISTASLTIDEALMLSTMRRVKLSPSQLECLEAMSRMS
jgi:hypothetical protein